jgi:hypothetical protein
MRKILALLLLAGCSGGNHNGPDGGGNPDMAGSNALTLVSANYSLQPMTEAYECARVTATRDWLIHTVTPVNGVATHHQVVGIDPQKRMPDTDPTAANPPICPGIEVMNWNLIFADGVGSPSLTMPDGVVMHVHAGDQLVFQLHLLNASPNAVTSSASVQVVELPAAQVTDEAQMILAGPVQFSIPPGPNQVINGKCTMKGPTHFYAVFPHMHVLGTHISVNAVVGGVSQSVYDAAYDFTNQTFASFTPIAMNTGDQIAVTCTYDNTTGGAVNFGTSTTQEMCFAISYRYPALAGGATGSLCPY